MTHIYPAFAYGPGPRNGCWWDKTVTRVDRPELASDLTCGVAIIGGGFTGLSAALHLAKARVDVAVLERETVGWGASGRNGGFCCLGGGRASDAQLLRRFGPKGLADWCQAEVDAVRLVDSVISDHGMDVDRHSEGETLLAHRPRDVARLREEAEHLSTTRGIPALIIEKQDLAAHGMNGPFHAAMTTGIGFALNPRKYLDGLARAAEHAGARIYHHCDVQGIEQCGGKPLLRTGTATVRAKNVIVATNGYSSETIPGWLADRYMPTQSSVLVTRVLTDGELQDQGWTTSQMAYDSRNLLHYFRLMPDRRFLFGMRGGLLSSAAGEAASRARVRRDFEAMFPAWRDVESQHQWSGLVCLARRGSPFVGPVPGCEGVFAGLCYHGNGVAMGSYAGAVLADLVLKREHQQLYPDVMRTPLARFGFGRLRRLLLPPAYLRFSLQDR